MGTEHEAKAASAVKGRVKATPTDKSKNVHGLVLRFARAMDASAAAANNEDPATMTIVSTSA